MSLHNNFKKKLLLSSILMILLFSACVGRQDPASSVEPTPAYTQTLPPIPTETVLWFPPTSTPTPISTPIAKPTEDMRPSLGRVLIRDTFQPSTRWDTLQSDTGSILFGKEELTIAISEPKTILTTFLDSDSLSDFYLEITANPSLCRGTDMYGLVYRMETFQDFYRLVINCNGEIRLERWKNGNVAALQNWTPSSQIPPGSPLVVRIGLWAAGKEMRVFVNDFYQFSVIDPVLPAGKIGLFARSGGETALTVNFSEFSVREIMEITSTVTPSPSPSR